ncbi:MAG: hypothetical protein AAF236_05485, partial [Verrucomicrobiota bacterium]
AAGCKLISLPRVDQSTLIESSQEGPFRVKIASPDAPVFDLFRSGDHGSPEGIAGTDRRRFSEAPEGDLWLSFEDGQPALIRPQANRYWWMIPLRDVPGNFAGRVEFLPMLAELLLVDRSNDAGNTLATDFEPGESVLWTAPESIDLDRLSLETDGSPMESSSEEVSHPFVPLEGDRYETAPFTVPGLYRWSLDEEAVGISAVNFPTIESDLTSLSLEEARSNAAVAVAGGAAVRDLRDGISLWPWLLAAAACFFVSESLVASWAARTA